MAKASKAVKAKKETGSESYVVTTQFRDVNNFGKVYEVGDDVSDLHPDRLKKLVDLGYVNSEAADSDGE